MSQTDFLAKAFSGDKRLNKKSEVVKEYPNGIDTRVALLEMSISHINETLIRMEKRFDRVDEQFEDIRKEIKDVRTDMKFDFRFVIGAICGFAGIMAHGFHWI